MEREKSGLTIRLSGLKAGEHEYVFDLTDSFFAGFENSLISKAEINVVVSLYKQENTLDLTIKCKGFATLSCVRCLEEGNCPIDTEDRLVFEFAWVEEVEEDDDLTRIPFETPEIDLSQPVYDFVSLAIPMRFTCEEAGKECDSEMENLLESTSYQVEKPEETTVDPRWEKLKNLKLD